jgi:hypothetical protein
MRESSSCGKAMTAWRQANECGWYRPFFCVMKRVAVMQPYLFPYAGYFRLFAAADHFVIFDCVQFPRRGRVHRTQVPGPSGENEWLSLPLARQPREVLIRDLEFAADARERFDERLGRHPWIERSHGRAAARIRDFLFEPLDAVDDFLERGLRLVGEILELPVLITRSSALRLDPALTGQDRVLAAAKAVGATTYVNAPGGHELYDAEAFAREGMELRFLSPYTGRWLQLLPALMRDEPRSIRQDILERTELLAP